MNQPVGHMVRISTKENPAPARWVSRARSSIFLVRATLPAVLTAPRATKAAPSSWASSELSRIGRPWQAGSRPSRLVLVRWPSTVVAVMWPPVSPNTPLLSMMQVTFSPRAAVWSDLLQALVDHVAVALHGEHDRCRAGPA